MDTNQLSQLLEKVKLGEVSIDVAVDKLKKLPYDDLGFAKIDNHRALRKGFPEVIYCEGKAPEHVVAILTKMAKEDINVLATRASQTLWELVDKEVPGCNYNRLGRVITFEKNSINAPKGSILVMSAGTADIGVAEEAYETARIMGNHVVKLYDVGVAGIHRLFDNLEIIQKARVVIVVAGMEGALASVVGGLIDKPLISVPTSVGYGASLNGIAALLTMLNSCASGMAVVNIDNGFGAGYMASLINQL